MDSPFHSTHTLCEHVDEHVDASSISAAVGPARGAEGFGLAAFLRVGEAGERSLSRGGGGGGGGALLSLACIVYTLAHTPPTDDASEDTRIACSLSSLLLLLLLIPQAQSHPLIVAAEANHVCLISICDGKVSKGN